MPVVMDQDTINIRIIFLDMERQKLQQKQAVANDEQMAALVKAIEACDAKLEECNDWLRILNQDPGWGELINVGGRKIPKLPTFKSVEELNWRLKNPEKTWREDSQGLNYEETSRAREYNARNNADESVRYMDSNGPFSVLERQGLSEEDAITQIQEKACPASGITPPSNDES